jgi:hypothetical protein
MDWLGGPPGEMAMSWVEMGGDSAEFEKVIRT